MDAPLSTLKYRPANAHPLALERAYLRNFFSSAFDVPLVILEADSGYGKTTTLSSVAQREGVSARWLTVDDSDSNLHRFAHNLLESIYCREIPRETAPLNERKALDHILAAIHELSVSAIFLDNFEAISRAEPVNRLLDQLIDEMPQYTRLIVATKRPTILRSGSRKRNRSAILTQPDLRFDMDDVSQYFLKVHNYHLTPEDAAFITVRTQGKPLIINLLGQLTRNLPSYLRIDWKMLPMGPQPETITLLLREVIARLPRALARVAQEVSSAAAAPSDGNSPVCDLLDTLAERHCLVHQYCHSDNTVINVAHEIFVELSVQI